MKKYLVLFISVIILSLSLCIPSFAANKRVITLSDDYKYMYYDSSTYTRADTSMLNFTTLDTYMTSSEEVYESDEVKDIPVNTVSEFVDYGSYYTVKLTDTQREEVKTVEITNSSYDETLFFVTVYFKDGSELYIDFIREDLIDEYNKLINGNADEYYIDFLWPDNNTISAKKDKFFTGSKTTINAWDYEYDYPVYASTPTESFDAEIGIILKLEGSYYFYSFIESNIKSSLDFYNMPENQKIKVIKLSDTDIIEKIKIGEERRQDDDFGYLYNDELKEAVAKIFFALVFAVVPAIVFVASLILAIKSKKAMYKKLLFVTSGISLAEIATFIYIAFTLFNK